MCRLGTNEGGNRPGLTALGRGEVYLELIPMGASGVGRGATESRRKSQIFILDSLDPNEASLFSAVILGWIVWRASLPRCRGKPHLRIFS